MEPDSGTTNVRNTSSDHWKRWLGVENRCLVPFTAFGEFNREAGGNVWFALDEDRPLAFFAGISAPQWTSVRKVKTGEETIDVFAFLTAGREGRQGRPRHSDCCVLTKRACCPPEQQRPPAERRSPEIIASPVRFLGWPYDSTRIRGSTAILYDASH